MESRTDLFGNILKGIRNTFGFRKIARRAGQRFVLEYRGGILGAFGELKNDVKWGQKSDGFSGLELGGYVGPTMGAGADPS